ncbi:MAG: GNAT family N-acetyltransferase [Ancrocorticia sp.]|uniref:GNAT family N-acetyltransferase n=1 Tax=Ancrocorticia sp. TaxID=2593684 RepID=UPI003F9257F8
MNLELRSMGVSDAEELASWATDPLFCAHAGWKQRTSTAEAVASWREAIEKPDPLLTRLMVIRDNEPMGYVDLYGDTLGMRELGFVIGPSRRWRQGVGIAAANAGLAYGFATLGLTQIWAEAVEANVASVRILRRIGMKETGIGSTETFLGSSSRYIQFSISRRDWLENCQLNTLRSQL